MRIWQPCFAIWLLLFSSHAVGQSFSTYRNERYGFSVMYPSDFKMDPPPENGDGRRFFKDNGCSIIASGINNIGEESVASGMRSGESNFDKITYRSKGKNWFVLSGYKGSDVLYIKSYVGVGASNDLWIRYPQTLAKEYSAITIKVSESFKPGDLKEVH